MSNELITVNAEYLPDIKREDIKDVYRVAKKDLPNLGLASQVKQQGLYKCVFPNGVNGTLAKAKDGSGNLGTIINNEGIAGQARFIEQSVNPTAMFAAAALHNIEEKLEELVALTKDLFEFEQIKEESKMTGDAQFLTTTLRDYQYNVGNKLWMQSKMSTVADCQNRAFAYVDEYKKLAALAAKDAGLMDRLVHTDSKAQEKVDKTIRNLENYQKAVFLYAFSQYVHVLVTESYKQEYLTNITNDIYKLSVEYRNIFSSVSYQLEQYANKSIDLKMIDMAGGLAKKMGELAEKTPLIEKTGTAKALRKAGDSFEQHSKKSIDEKIKHVSKYQKAPIRQFQEDLLGMKDIGSKEIELYYDDEYLLIAKPETV